MCSSEDGVVSGTSLGVYAIPNYGFPRMPIGRSSGRPDTRPVQTVNSAHCSLLSGGSWDQNKCGHHIYGNGRHIASRHFPSIQNLSHFLNTCIKVQISAAQYKDGGNFNNGHSNPRACILVKTAGSFA
ncbi:hypothetical protein CBR_g54346 [Chara braunii]|uniref:Uncharacterized protein n=1 Tax=Chara braunii TaxID=69332 RepID=A0A388MC01_CHABU|nr:hypothetical protein CBR_g54346 [Chara braunii]|eukprot:GBG92091.1 hypothetical protein CBR_g54346 [Chara braunii]